MGPKEAPSCGLKLPFIDFSKPLQQGTTRWESLKSQVREALEEYGCFEVSIDDRFSGEFRSDVFRSLEELFDRPLSMKQASTNREAFYLGYLGQHPHYPGFESFGIDDPILLGVVETFTNTLWGQGGNPIFSKNIHSLAEVLCGVDQIVRRMIVESFGVEKHMDEHMSSTTYHFRVMKYEASETLDKRIGLKVHTDKNIMTTLCENEVEGLEVQIKTSEWVKFKPASPGSLVVLAGDSLYAWLNGRVHLPYHRVTLSGNNKPRYSLGLFTAPKAGSTVKAPEELIDEQNPLMFKPYLYKQYLDLAYNQAGAEEEAPLRAFYGL